MSHYHVTVKGVCANGQQTANHLYYKDGFNLAAVAQWLSSPYNRCRALAFAVISKFFTDPDGFLPLADALWSGLLDDGWHLTGIAVSSFSSGLGFPPETAAPIEIVPAGANTFTGHIAEGVDGYDAVAVISFGLTYQPVTEGVYQPKRHNVRIGPISSAMIEDGGALSQNIVAALQPLADALATTLTMPLITEFTEIPWVLAYLEQVQDITDVTPGDILTDFADLSFDPVAYGRKLLVPATPLTPAVYLDGYSAVNSAAVRPYASRLKSRRVGPQGN
jgi:hypothetical protein